MPIDSGNLALKGLDELFSTEEKRQEEQREQVQQIPIDELHPFTNHPFKVVDDEAMTRTVESIAQFGVLAPLNFSRKPDESTLTTLCPRCLNAFRNARGIRVRRADPYQLTREPCTYCQTNFGYDYYIQPTSPT